MDVVIIGQNGSIDDKKYDKDVINRFANNPSYVTENIAFVADDDCFIYRISQSSEQSDKNIHATNLLSNENNPIYGETMIVKISKGNEIQDINVDYLMAYLINNVNIKEEKKDTYRSSNMHTYDNYYDNYYDEIEEHFGGYDSC